MTTPQAAANAADRAAVRHQKRKKLALPVFVGGIVGQGSLQAGASTVKGIDSIIAKRRARALNNGNPGGCCECLGGHKSCSRLVGMK